MSDHRDTPDPRTDITDLYVFPAPGGGDWSVLVLNINPDACALESSFDPLASYELKIDTRRRSRGRRRLQGDVVILRSA